jgi:hypothetical protein
VPPGNGLTGEAARGCKACQGQSPILSHQSGAESVSACELTVKYPDAPRRVLRRGNAYLSDAALRATRLRPGGPEAFIEAFANIYREAARAIRAEVNGSLTPEGLDFPTVDEGLEGMAFINAAVQSAKAGGVWTKMPAST